MSPTSTDRITLTDSQHRELTRMTRAGRTEQRLVTRAQIVLAAAAGVSNAQIARWLRICEDPFTTTDLTELLARLDNHKPQPNHDPAQPRAA